MDCRRSKTDDTDAQPPGLGLLALAACPLGLWFFHGSMMSMLSASVLLALFALALWLVSEGIHFHTAYDATEIALRPRLPRKLIGSALIGLLVLILSATQLAGLLPALGCGAVATGLCLAAFGIDPMRDKGTDDPAFVLRERARAASETAEHRLDHLVARIDILADPDLCRQTDAMCHAVTRLSRALSQDPDAMRPLLRPLMKFLDMALHETDRLIDAWPTENRDFARKRFLAKLAAMVEAFESRARRHPMAVGQDNFELEADLLIDRMVRETTA